MRPKLVPVYPRWRGEHDDGVMTSGKSLRFIPAGAGNTRRPHPPLYRIAVYPRWRGEHAVPDQHRSESIRFIPAGAGNTFRHQCPAVPPAVYPRWRGEHAQTKTLAKLANGLSPLARGTRFCQSGDRRGSRFIPAGAGNTSAGMSPISCRAVYPRWRGEHMLPHAVICRWRGLSPLARGTLLEYMVELKCIFKDLKSYQIFSPSEKTQPFDL